MTTRGAMLVALATSDTRHPYRLVNLAWPAKHYSQNADGLLRRRYDARLKCCSFQSPPSRFLVEAAESRMPGIREWLNSHGLSEYADRFAQNRIDLSILPDLTDDDLKELGVLLGDRRRILRLIAEPAPKSQVPAISGSRPLEGAERRQVTVMFADLVGSTALSTGMDPEDLRDVFAAYSNCAEETVSRFGGNVGQYMGDGI